VEGEHWFVEYEFLPGKWQRLTKPFSSEAEAEAWRRQFFATRAAPGGVC
jgi:hypothetical protein